LDEVEGPAVTADRWLDDGEVVEAASARGWRLVEQPVAATSVWRWMRFTDEIWPSFRQRTPAITWMRERLIGAPSEMRRHSCEQPIAACGLVDVDVAAVLVASEHQPDRVAFETRTINRALKHDLVLYANALSNSELVFGWRSGSERIGPQFDDRAVAINWIAEWLAENVD